VTLDLTEFLRAERLPASYADLVRRLHAPLARRIAEAARAKGSACVVGLTGSQASGKTTSAAVLARLLEAEGLRPAILALDDLYLPLADRRRLAAEVHPLLLTRGVPGTHDAALGAAILESLGRPGETLIPRFDKASDDRLPADASARVLGPVDVILFEGWCVGARPQAPEALAQPVNDLERDRDPDGTWRAYANNALAGPYRALFDPLDFQVLFAAPSFDAVLAWRIEQEQKLRARLAETGAAGPRGQTDAEIAVFIRHYERLTRHILAEMPARADVVVRLAPDREVTAIDGLG
jgi:D-glycerate 3-kinase